jgi:hypothetical protein
LGKWLILKDSNDPLGVPRENMSKDKGFGKALTCLEERDSDKKQARW